MFSEVNFLGANPAIRSQTLSPNNGVKGFPLLSGLGQSISDC